MIHGDDFLALGDRPALAEVESLLKKNYELKCLGVMGMSPEMHEKFIS